MGSHWCFFFRRAERKKKNHHQRSSPLSKPPTFLFGGSDSPESPIFKRHFIFWGAMFVSISWVIQYHPQNKRRFIMWRSRTLRCVDRNLGRYLLQIACPYQPKTPQVYRPHRRLVFDHLIWKLSKLWTAYPKSSLGTASISMGPYLYVLEVVPCLSCSCGDQALLHGTTHLGDRLNPTWKTSTRDSTAQKTALRTFRTHDASFLLRWYGVLHDAESKFLEAP